MPHLILHNWRFDNSRPGKLRMEVLLTEQRKRNWLQQVWVFITLLKRFWFSSVRRSVQLRCSWGEKGSHGVKWAGCILGNDWWWLKEKGDEVEGLLLWAPAGASSGSCSFVIIRKKKELKELFEFERIWETKRWGGRKVLGFNCVRSIQRKEERKRGGIWRAAEIMWFGVAGQCWWACMLSVPQSGHSFHLEQWPCCSKCNREEEEKTGQNRRPTRSSLQKSRSFRYENKASILPPKCLALTSLTDKYRRDVSKKESPQLLPDEAIYKRSGQSESITSDGL